MNAKELNQEFLEAVRLAIPTGTNMVKVIETALGIGKEAVYRRIRGDVPFTFDEVVALILKFGMSLDRFLKIKYQEKVVYDLNQISTEKPLDDYYNMLSVSVEMFKEFNRNPEAKMYMAYNIVPFAFLDSLEHLWKFDIYQLLHQVEQERRIEEFSQVTISKSLVEKRDQLFTAYRSVPWSCYILDRRMFTSLLKEIGYLYRLGLISREDITHFKQEFHQMFDLIEVTAASGRFHGHHQMTLYLSNLDLEGSYCCYECPEMNFTHLRVYRLGMLNSSTPEIFMAQRHYIESLKRFSTLITKSGEMERSIFLREQRDLVDAL
jgi:DNA-binding phage protein